MSMMIRSALFAAPFLLVACGGASSDDGASTGDTGSIAATVGGGVIHGNDMILGDKNAPVTLIEYASVTCGGCAAAHRTIIPELKSNYVDTGKVKFVFREYPKAPAQLSNQSFLGSVIARCAAEKGGEEAYFVVIDALLKQQQTWIFGDTEGELTKIASQAGMDREAFDACLQRQDLLDVINTNVDEAETAYKIPGTPTFILDGEIVRVGSFEDLASKIDEKLGEDAPAE